jgi:hypothetical protein
MNRFDGTAARQLELLDASEPPVREATRASRRRTDLRLLRKDVYAELARRRRRAQIHARHLLDAAGEA